MFLLTKQRRVLSICSILGSGVFLGSFVPSSECRHKYLQNYLCQFFFVKMGPSAVTGCGWFAGLAGGAVAGYAASRMMGGPFGGWGYGGWGKFLQRDLGMFPWFLKTRNGNTMHQLGSCQKETHSDVPNYGHFVRGSRFWVPFVVLYWKLCLSPPPITL